MKQHELEALKKLGIPIKKWGDDYRVKVRGKNGRFVYVSNISKTFYASQIAKQYPKVFKDTDIKKRVNILKSKIEKLKPNERVWNGKNHKTVVFECMPTKTVFKHLKDILNKETETFKVAVSLSYRLKNIYTGEDREWKAGTNTYLFDHPIAINSKDQINSKIMTKLYDTDLTSKIKYPSSAWKLEEITGFSASIYYRNHKLGADVKLPDVIKQNRHIVNYPNTQNKCVFYCLAGFLNPDKDYRRLSTPVKTLFKEYCAFKNIEYSLPYFKSFEGMDIYNFHELEECFKLRINVYTMDIDTIELTLLRESKAEFDRTVNVLDYEGHAMFIPRIDNLLTKYPCNRCDQIFNTCEKLKSHKRSKCAELTLDAFVNKPTVYVPMENRLKKMLSKYSIDGVDDHYMDHFIVYDFEAMLKKIDSGPSETTKYVSQHVPMSVSICDSLTRQVRCFVSEDPKDLLKQMFGYITDISSRITDYNKEKFKSLIDLVEDRCESARKKMSESKDKNDTSKWSSINRDRDEIDRLMDQTIVLGFNSGRYDINLIKKDLFSVIGTECIRMVIKNPNYMCIETNTLKILDISNYLPAGTSYDSYLKSYLGGCKCDDKIACTCGLTKGVFPYEYITSFEKLNETELPPKAAFYSSKNNAECSDEDYARVKFAWTYHNMKSVKDLLIWYNNLDVEPFVEAVLEQRKFYRSFGLDIFMDGVSLPSLAEKIMYQVSHNEMLDIKPSYGEPFKFPKHRLVGYKKQDDEAKRDFNLTLDTLDTLLSRQNYCCYHCKTALTEDNASADRINNYKGHLNDNVIMSCINCNVGRKNMPLHLYAKLKKVEYNSKRLVYSIDAENKDIFYKMKKNIAGGPSIIFSRYAETDRTYIRGFKNPDAKLCKKVIGYDANALYLWALGSDMPCGRLTTVETYDSILEDIKADKLFGFLECDIETPQHLKEYFSEMTPIFKNIEIDPKDRTLIGDHMYEHNQSLEQPKTQKSKKLIGSYFGKQILIYTPLLKWYLDHGMKVTKSYSFIKASHHQPFKGFADKVSDARREGDKDDSKAMIAEMMKLVGNSAFGRSGMDKSKHKEVKYASADESVRAIVEKPEFNNFEELDGAYEISMNKRRIKLNNPIHLSIAIYQLAKLRMLQFYYDCIDFYFDRSDFQYVEMDTDSAYMTFSDEEPFENLIKPELRDQFEQNKHLWFPRDDTKENAMFDRRTPGLFKEEWRGNGIYALASKNYVCFNPDEGHKQKISSKGVQGSNDKQNKRNADVLCPEAFGKIISREEVSIKATNKGFRIDRTTHSMITYEQTKIGISYYYDKRKVLSDGITTEPLDL